MLEDISIRDVNNIIKERHVDWTSINASYVPILDIGELITATDVEGALAEAFTVISTIDFTPYIKKDGTVVMNNGTYLKWRDEYNTTDINVLRLGAGNITELNSPGTEIRFTGNGGLLAKVTNSGLTVADTKIFYSNDADYAHTFGRCVIGYDGATSDVASFSHRDQTGSGKAALYQTTDGVVSLNSPTGQNILITPENTLVGTWSTSGLSLAATMVYSSATEDGTHVLGRAGIGTNGTTNSAYFGINARKHLTGGFFQKGTGEIEVRAESASTITFFEGANTIARIEAAGLYLPKPISMVTYADNPITIYRPDWTVGRNTGLKINFYDDLGAEKTYAQILGEIEDASNGAEHGAVVFKAVSNGSVVEIARAGSEGLKTAPQKSITFGVFTDANRGSAGNAGRVIYNSDDSNLNIDDGTNWILPDGTTT